MSSKSEARRAIKGKAIKINNNILIDDSRVISVKDFSEKNFKNLFW